MKYGRILLGLSCALLVFAGSARAQDASDGTLHVLRPVIHAEQEEAELCLEFDHDLDSADRGRIASAIKLESGGKVMSIKPQNISVIAGLLCLPSLEHRREYRIVVAGIHGTKGERLASPYGLVFTVPDRQPSLSFTGNAADEGITRWHNDDPVLRSVNVPRVHIELYRLSDPAMMAAAWRERQQTTLAPTESATFGHDHGQMIWSGELALDDTPNKTLEQAVPLHDAVHDTSPGLYLIVARAYDAKTDVETGTTSLATTGAAWLLRSDLRMGAVRDTGGFYGLTEKADASAIVKNVRLLAEDADGQTLAEIRSDVNGVGFLPLAGDKINGAAVLVGFTDAGDADFADLSVHATGRFAPPENEMSMTMDKTFYLPASSVSVMLITRDAQGHPVSKSSTKLVVTRPDGSSLINLSVPTDASGVVHLTFPAPAVGGIWPLVWRGEDGSALAQAFLRVTADPDAPRMEMNVDRAIISRDGDINLTLKSLAGDGKPEPYMTGRVFAAWISPDTVFREWKDYHFGNGGPNAGDVLPLKSFVTDEKGMTSIHLTLTPPDDHALLHSVVLSVQSDAAAGGVAVPVPLTVPMKPKEGIIGIKPLAPDGRFPENGFARFAIVALDADGHRRSADDLNYQIFEEGRSFDWYQAEGRWNYKPLQQKRRIGGGALTLGTGRDDIIEWPVAAGTYRLEITDANGAVRASTGFGAGWGLPDTMPAPSPLALTPSASVWRTGQDIQVRFTLDRPSMINAFVGDDHIRKIIHQLMPQGESSLTFTPEKDWNDRINLRVVAEDLNLAGQITLSRVSDMPDAVKMDAPKNVSPSEILTIDTAFPAVLRTGDSAHLFLNLVNNSKKPEAWHYTVGATAGLKISASGLAAISAGQSRKIPLVVNAVHAGISAVRLDVTGPPHFHTSREWTIAVVADGFGLGSAVRERIEPQQSTSWPPHENAGEKQHAKNDSVLFLSAAPLYGAPGLLADVLNDDVFTTGEIAGVLETLRLWRGTIIASGLLTEADIGTRERNLLLRLIARQKPDGSFSRLPENQPDFISTSQALIALTHSDQSAAKPAMEQASGWLRQRLENTWFDEHERPERAAAYAALAEAGRLDNASLHYFSDTSAQKALPPLAAVQLAFAFAAIGDQPASSFWIDVAGAGKNLSSLPAALAPVLAANTFIDMQNLLPSLDALSTEMGAHPPGEIESATNILRAIWMVQNRKGAWQVTVNTDKRNPKDILVVSVPAKTAAPLIHNTSNDPVFLAGMQKVDVLPSGAGSMTRHIYQLNGTEAGGNKPLDRDETYLVVLEGPWPSGASGIPALVHDDPGPALRIAGCLPPAPIEADDSLAWLKSQTLTASTSCETWDGGIDMLLVRNDNGGKNGAWRVAYLVKALWAGAFDLQPASAHALAADHADIARTSRDRIEIR